jgi:hypothetical protein
VIPEVIVILLLYILIFCDIVTFICSILYHSWPFAVFHTQVYPLRIDLSSHRGWECVFEQDNCIGHISIFLHNESWALYHVSFLAACSVPCAGISIAYRPVEPLGMGVFLCTASCYRVVSVRLQHAITTIYPPQPSALCTCAAYNNTLIGNHVNTTSIPRSYSSPNATTAVENPVGIAVIFGYWFFSGNLRCPFYRI